MLELAMLESTLTTTPEKEEKGLTEVEESTLDSIMQGLGIESDGSNDIDENLDLDAIAGAIASDDDDDIDLSGVETHDFNAEFGLYACLLNKHSKRITFDYLEIDRFKSCHRLADIALSLCIK